MNDSQLVVGITAGLLPLAAITFRLVVSIIAKKRVPGRGANLMLISTILGILLKLVAVLVGTSHRTLGLELEDVATAMNGLGILESLSGALFLVGVLLLVRNVSNRVEATTKHLIDQ